MKKFISSLKSLLKEICIEKPFIILLVVLFIISLLFIPNFSSGINLLNILNQAPTLIIAACGLTFVILNGGIDFSITSIIGLGSVVGASIMSEESGFLKDSILSVPVAIFMMLSIGIIIGIINGFAVTKLKMPSFMATMATKLVFGGLAIYYTKSDSIAGLPSSYKFFGSGSLLGIPFSMIIVIIIVVIFQFILSKTIFGRQIFSIGTNPIASYIAGIPVKKTILKLFIISGFLAALSGVIMTARVGAGKPVLADGMLLDIITAVIIGGTSIAGGSGSLIGTAFGAIFIVTINSALSILGVQWYVISVIKGILLLLVAVLDTLRRQKSYLK